MTEMIELPQTSGYYPGVSLQEEPVHEPPPEEHPYIAAQRTLGLLHQTLAEQYSEPVTSAPPAPEEQARHQLQAAQWEASQRYDVGRQIEEGLRLEQQRRRQDMLNELQAVIGPDRLQHLDNKRYEAHNAIQRARHNVNEAEKRLDELQRSIPSAAREVPDWAQKKSTRAAELEAYQTVLQHAEQEYSLVRQEYEQTFRQAFNTLRLEAQREIKRLEQEHERKIQALEQELAKVRGTAQDELSAAQKTLYRYREYLGFQ